MRYLWGSKSFYEVFGFFYWSFGWMGGRGMGLWSFVSSWGWEVHILPIKLLKYIIHYHFLLSIYLVHMSYTSILFIYFSQFDFSCNNFDKFTCRYTFFILLIVSYAVYSFIACWGENKWKTFEFIGNLHLVMEITGTLYLISWVILMPYFIFSLYIKRSEVMSKKSLLNYL